jgi:hypothetical protein
MATLTEIVNRLSSVDVMTLTGEAVVESKRDYLDLQLSQVSQGQDGKEKEILLDGNPYTAYTKDLKAKYGVGLGKVTDRVTLYQTGAMYKTADLNVNNENINVTFDTEYSSELLQRTGDITGLNDSNREVYINGGFITAFKALFEQKTQLQLT